MSEAPERVRVWPDYNDHTTPVSADWTGGYWDNTDDPKGTDYTRTDLVRAQIEAAVKRALEGAAEEASVCWMDGVPYPECEDYIRRLDPAQFIDGDRDG